MIATYFKILLREMIRLTVRILYLIPIHKNRILFESFQGRSFSDNPFEIFRYLSDLYGDRYEYICSLTDPSSLPEITGLRAVRYKSAAWFLVQATSAVIISNTLPITIFPKRKGQLFIETWHGGGAYKTLAVDFLGYSDAQRILVHWNNRLLCEKIDAFLSSSGVFSDVGIIRPYGYTHNICLTGMPRNDIFFDKERVALARQTVREHYQVRGRLILYAPTWRGTVFYATKKIDTLPDFEKILRAVPGSVILFRSHYADRNSYEYGERVIDAKAYPNMQELLCAADILITDYSSSIWDYALLGKPCFLYVPDLEEYQTVEHGFCTPIESWPGTVCRDMGELYAALSEIDPETHKKKAEEHLRALGSYETGTACRQVCDMISEFTQV